MQISSLTGRRRTGPWEPRGQPTTTWPARSMTNRQACAGGQDDRSGPGPPCGGDRATAAVAFLRVQAREGLTPQEFALFELPGQVMRSDHDVPSGGDLVF
ncbi:MULTISPECIES: hypothetical protein [unclassified Mycolicibacterium]|uniref:hypothetical protein n=1 Tax=unclassified Mycolicibacterium TaxID=2636767 RepID=UPI0012DBDB0A|nr:MULTISPECIES: hypothetical protein [unclassified Mycolicibacterium]